MTEIKSNYCMFNECKDQVKVRGLCKKHYMYYKYIINSNKTTFEKLEEEGLILARSHDKGRKYCTIKCIINNCDRLATAKAKKLCNKCLHHINCKIQKLNDLNQTTKLLQDLNLSDIKIYNCKECNKTTIFKTCTMCTKNKNVFNIHPKCIYTNCNNSHYCRGLCNKHYNICYESIQNNETTWEELEKEGLALKSKKRKLD